MQTCKMISDKKVKNNDKELTKMVYRGKPFTNNVEFLESRA